MAPYNYVFLFVAVLGIALCEIKKGRAQNLIFLAITSFVLIAMGYLRAESVAVDYPMYRSYFENVCSGGLQYLLSPDNPYRKEFGYGLLNYLVSLFSHDVHVFMGVLAFVTVGLTAWMAYRNSVSPWMTIFIFVSFGFWFNTLNFLRQQLSIVVFLLAIEFLKKKKLVPYVLIVLLAATFHNAILLMIPIYFLAHLPFNWKTFTFYGVCTFVLTLITMPVFDLITKYVYKFYTTEDGLYFMQGRDFMTGLFPLLLFIAAALFYKPLIRRNPQNVVLVNFSYFSCLLYLMTMQHFLYQRFGMMFFAIAELLIPEILKCCAPNEEKERELEKLTAEGKTSGNAHQMGVLKRQLQDQTWLYWSAIGLVILAGYAYYYFLMDSNRVLLVPYLTWLS